MIALDSKYKYSRRDLIRSLCGGLGSIGLASVLADEQARAATTHTVGPHFPPTAKHNIFLFLVGGPSQLDMFDPKPALEKYAGQRPPSTAGFRTERVTGGLLPSPFEFKRCGQSGIEVSELLPNLAKSIDDICVIRSMYTFNPTPHRRETCFTRGTLPPPGPPWGRGSRTVWGARTRTFRASWC